MKRRTTRLFALIAMLLTSSMAQSQLLKINEVQSANSISAIDEFDDFEDWIEIYNPNNFEVSISGWLISDDENDSSPWQLPDDEVLTIAPNDYLVLWADKEIEEGATHLPFSLSQAGESVYLWSDVDMLVTSLEFDFMWQDHSVGLNDQDETVAYDLPTPGMENFETYYQGTLTKPDFSQVGGVFNDGGIAVELTHENPNVTIHYTMDGTNPSVLSDVYSAPIDLSFNLTVKAVAVADDYIESPNGAQSYLFDVEHEVDIIAISCDESDFSGTGGINSSPFSGDEILIDVNYIEDGISEISQTMGMQVHGPDFRDQKSFRLYARGDYGKSRFDHPVFDNRDLNSYKRFILRNSGNDGTEIAGVGMRDPVIQSFYEDINPDYGFSASRAVVVYINGQYWGLYNLRERQDEFWMEDLYGYETDEVDFLERTAGVTDTRVEISGDWDDFDAMENEAIDTDLSDTDNYEAFIEQFNLRNFIDYQFLEIYINNQDWLSNNMKFWKPVEDGVWNWVIWDTDWGLGTFYPNYPHGFPDWNALSFALSDWGGWTSAVETEILQNLVENEQFVDDFSTRAADILNSYMKPAAVITRIQDFQAVMEPEIEEQLDQWGGISLGNWNNEIDYMADFVTQRPGYLRGHYTDMFSLGEVLPISLDNMPNEGGFFEVNTIEAHDIPWDGFYFELLDVRLKAVPNPGFVFSHWEGDVDSTDPEIWVDMAEVENVVAVYTPIEDFPSLVISEIFYNSDTEFTQEDWVEVYNSGPGTIDLQDWQICGGTDCYTITESLLLQEGEYIVFAEDLAAFDAEYDITNVTGDLGFGLSADGESLTILNPFGGIADVADYEIIDPWPVDVAPGHSIELLDVAFDNNVGGNWVAQSLEGGSPGEAYEEIVTDIDDMLSPNVRVWPNPFADYLLISLNVHQSGAAQIMLTNALGHIVAQSSLGLHAGENQFLVHDFGTTSIEDLEAGMYTLSISHGTKQSHLKVIKR